jgi:NDP-sugar pyrophosphorylase family protein
VNFKSNIIEDYFKDGSKWDANISYVREDKRMGTVGALSLIKSKFKKPFFVVNGDILTTVRYDYFLDFHEAKKSIATMGVKRYEYQFPYASVELDKEKRISKISEKPVYTNLINSGIYVLSPEIIPFVPKNEFYDMTTLFEDIIIEFNNVFTYSIDEYWLDVGHKSDYEKANGDIKKN